MSVIAIDVNNFALGYTVYHYQDSTAQQFMCPTFEDIAEFVPEYCFNNNISKVLINGAPEFAHELATMIYRNNFANYAERNLEIEVI